MSKDDAKIIQLWESATKERSTRHVDKDGNVRWILPDGGFHRVNGPAVENINGHKQWWLNNTLHRDDGPAMIYPSGPKVWYQHGKLHREDGPAIEYPSGNSGWYLDDVLYNDAWEWAEATLKWQGNAKPSEEEINAKVQQTLAQDILN